ADLLRAEFLHVNTVEFINLDEQGFEKVARTIIEIFRPASGKRSSKSFFNYSILEILYIKTHFIYLS
ncbi:hypothetical protein Q604_UNBC16087G0001, partial [human gut metagenome]